MKKTPVILLVGLLFGCGADGDVDVSDDASGDASDSLDGIALTYQGEGLSLDNSTNACLVTTSGGAFSTGSQLPPAESRELILSFNAEEGSHDWSPLGDHGSVADAELLVSGGFDLVNLDDGVKQMIAAPAACEADITFLETGDRPPFVDLYEVAFSCPLVPYMILSNETSEMTGEGSLSRFSGRYRCNMSKFDDGT